jgi:hypothetical protein
MGLEYQIVCGGEIDVAMVEKTLETVYGINPSAIRKLDNAYHLPLEGCFLYFRDTSGSRWADCISETYEFVPVVGLTFRFFKDDNRNGYATLYRAVDVLLKQPCDLVLLANGESPLLLKKGGKLTISRSWEKYIREYYDLTAVDYALADLPTL